MRTRILRRFVLVGLLLALGGGLPALADEGVAGFLIAEAKKAISKRNYGEAVVKLERALEEEPSLLEAAYLLGQVFEKKKEPSRALGAYRTFRDGCLERGSELDKKLARLLPRAEKRIALLGKGELELAKLQTAFAEELIRFARKVQEEDPDLAVDALRRLLSVAPESDAARRLLEDLTGEDAGSPTDDTDPTGGAIRGITSWDDLLERRAIPPGTDIQYHRGVLTVDRRGGTIFWTDPFVRAPDTFVYEVEFRFLEEYSNGYLLGLAFALDEEAAGGGANDLVLAMGLKSTLTLAQSSGGRNIDVGESAIPSVPLGTWRTLAVAVQGRKVRVFLDGKQRINSSVPGRRALSGPIGIFHQRSKVEIRRLRLGTGE